MSYESASAYPAFVLPEDIDHLLASSLLPVSKTQDRTPKFYIDGHPELFVRRPDAQVDEIEEALKAADAMRDYGIHVLPNRLVSHEGGNYVVTANITGIPLDELVKQSTESLVSDVDIHMSKLAEYLVGEAEDDKSTAKDVYTLDQFMRGTIQQAEGKRTWLVDLPDFVADDDDYAFNVRQLTNSILGAEKLTDVKLTVARFALGKTLELLPLLTTRGDDTAEAVQRALDTNTPVKTI